MLRIVASQFLPIGERELPRGQTPPSPLLSSPSHQSVKPLYCSPNLLWHLCFGHASTTTLRKLLYIISSHDSTHCVVCIRAKQTRKPLHTSESKVSRKPERIHSDICGPFPTSKGLTKLLLAFLDEYSHWCWVVTIDGKSSATVNREFRMSIKQIEPESEQQSRYAIHNRLLCRIHKHWQHHVAGMGLGTKRLCQLSRPHLFRDTIPKAIRL